MEAWLAWTCDVAVAHDSRFYAQQRPVAFSSWPTLDPLVHPTETSGAEEDALRRARGEATPVPEYPSPVYNEDSNAVDAERVIAGPEDVAGLFASYHIYPYYPDFMNLDPVYADARDADGPNRYLGYLRALKAHHRSQPLLVAELGLPTSRGAVHVHPQGWNHGGHTGAEQGLLVARMMRSVADARGAGGIVFAWIDEWFKRNWLHDEYELPAERNALWRNALDPEQNYGIVGACRAGARRPSPRWERGGGAPSRPPRCIRSPHPSRRRTLLRRASPSVRAGIDADAAYLHLCFGGRRRCVGMALPMGAWSLLRGSTLHAEAPESGASCRAIPSSPPGSRVSSALGRGRGPISRSSRRMISARITPGTVRLAAGRVRGFVRMIREVNRERIGRDGTVYPAIHLDQSPLRFLDAAPASGDLADVATAARDTTAVLELRLAWGLLQFTDPSSRTLLWQTQSHWPPFDTAKSERVIVHLSLRDAEGHEIDSHSLPAYTWPTWEEPAWHLARKSSTDPEGGVRGLADASSRRGPR